MKTVKSENPRMNVLSDDQIQTIEKAIQFIDKNLSIHEINYDTGTVSVAMTYNKGTPNEWTEQNFIVVNVNADSEPALFKDVFNQVYSRCI